MSVVVRVYGKVEGSNYTTRVIKTTLEMPQTPYKALSDV